MTKPKDHFVAFGFESTNLLDNLQVVFLFMIGMLVAPIIIKLAELILSFSQGTIHIINDFKREQVYWNFYLRFFLETYLELNVVSLLRI